MNETRSVGGAFSLALALVVAIGCGGAAVDDPPVLSPIPTQAAQVGEPFRLQVAAYVWDDAASAVELEYAMASGPGAFEGSELVATFTEEGTVTIAFVVADPSGQTTAGTVIVTVEAPPPPPVASPMPAAGPAPDNGAVDTDVEVAFTWTGGEGADRFDVYLTTELLSLVDADPSSAAFAGSVTDASFAPGARLDPELDYYWRVDAANAGGVTRGPVWTFRTEPANYRPRFGGLQDAVAIDDTAVGLSWNAGTDVEEQSDALTYAVYGARQADGIDFASPLFTTPAGATSAVVTRTDLATITGGANLVFAVRVVDSWGDQDTNEVIVPVGVPMAADAVVFVDDDAADGGTGTASAPFATVQAGLEAVETAGGGTVLIASGVYNESVVMTAEGDAPIRFVGGFASFAATDSAAERLATRDASAAPSVIDGIDLGVESLLATPDGGRPVQIAGLAFDRFASVAVYAPDAALRVTGCTFAPIEPDESLGYAIDIQSVTEGATMAVAIHGSVFEGLDDAIRVGGFVDELTVSGNRFEQLDGDAIYPSWVSGDSSFVLPAGGSTRIRIEDNRGYSMDRFLDEIEFAAEDPEIGNDLDVWIARNVVNANFSANAFDLYGVGEVGAGGRATVRFVDNDVTGVSSDCFEVDIVGDNAPRGAVDVLVENNSCVHTNSDGFDIDRIGAADGETTSVVVRHNRISHTESRGVELTWVSDDELYTAGTVVIEVTDNETFQVDDTYDFDIYGPEGLVSWIFVWNNNDFATHGDSISFEDYCSDPEDADDDDGSTGVCETNVWIAWNQMTGSTEDGSVDAGFSEGAVATITNNNGGLCDVDSSEALDLEQNGYGGGQVTVQNNVFALGAGEGIDVSSTIFPRLVNNTVTANGRDSSSQRGINQGGSDNYGQIQVINSIVTLNSGGDLSSWDPDDDDEDGRAQVDSQFSLIGDRDAAVGWNNMTGDPIFVGSDDLDDFSNNYRLAPTSPAIDAGDPSPEYRDADGSRNDLGAFGGPAGGMTGYLGPGATRPLEVIGMRPMLQLREGGSLPAGSQPVHILFTNEVAPASATAANIRIETADGPVAGTFAVDGRTVTFTPDAAWPAAEDVRVTVGDVADADGQTNRYPWTRVFGTAPSAAVIEVEPNDDPDTATVLGDAHFQATGTLDPADDAPIDVYTFTAEAGQRLSATVFSARRGEAGEVTMLLFRPDETEVRRASNALTVPDAEGRDPYLDHVFTESGTYVLVLFDETGAIDPGELRAPGLAALT